ncbi:hypothetical protein GCM10010911_58010 [Paenibacillus nasutitermitis]|uniref:Glycosyl hydrolase family 32 C-terminal domain-containing protein n=1 Tax=Paenibacillus nasutitermitis TaxID=1652958 RepID=A0A916ZF19_9BACL|nr:hypothetical protein GCM10010911_58010 [Paenibacillus nasutitermitis]
MRASEEHKEETLVIYNSEENELSINRDKSGGGVTGISRCVLKPAADGTVKLHLFVDRSSIEVFGNDGRVAASNRIYPHLDNTGLDLYARSGTAKLLRLDVWKLESGGL